MSTNQCDGCMSGFELNMGLHLDGDHVHMVCTKARYAPCNNGCPDWEEGKHKMSCRFADSPHYSNNWAEDATRPPNPDCTTCGGSGRCPMHNHKACRCAGGWAHL